MTTKWLLPALGFIVVTGLLGVTVKLALRHLKWPELLMWTAIVYVVLALGSVALGNRTMHLDVGALWALASGICAAAGFIFASIALRYADAGVAVPVMAAYPLVTMAGSIAFLAESFSPSRAIGAALVVSGVVLLTR